MTWFQSSKQAFPSFNLGIDFEICPNKKFQSSKQAFPSFNYILNMKYTILHFLCFNPQNRHFPLLTPHLSQHLRGRTRRPFARGPFRGGKIAPFFSHFPGQIASTSFPSDARASAQEADSTASRDSSFVSKNTPAL
jgi:hypothetical protein